MKADVPNDFKGVPILNNQKSHFFGFRSKRQSNDIENLWALFEKVVKNENFEDEYNAVVNQFISQCKHHNGIVLDSSERFPRFR